MTTRRKVLIGLTLVAVLAVALSNQFAPTAGTAPPPGGPSRIVVQCPDCGRAFPVEVR